MHVTFSGIHSILIALDITELTQNIYCKSLNYSGSNKTAIIALCPCALL